MTNFSRPWWPTGVACGHGARSVGRGFDSPDGVPSPAAVADRERGQAMTRASFEPGFDSRAGVHARWCAVLMRAPGGGLLLPPPGAPF